MALFFLRLRNPEKTYIIMKVKIMLLKICLMVQNPCSYILIMDLHVETPDMEELNSYVVLSGTWGIDETSFLFLERSRISLLFIFAKRIWTSDKGRSFSLRMAIEPREE